MAGGALAAHPGWPHNLAADRSTCRIPALRPAGRREGRYPSPDLEPPPVLTLLDALIAGADRELWARYCGLAAELEGRPAAPTPAPGSLEWQRQQAQPTAAEAPMPKSAVDAGRRRLSQRGAPPPFAGAPSPFGAAGGEAFAEFLADHRGSPSLLARIDAAEDQLVGAFEAAGRAGRFRAGGFRAGAWSEAAPDWFGRIRLDFARNAMLLPDGSKIAGIEVSSGASATDAPPSAAAGGRHRQRPAQAMLRQALTALWERGAFGAGTGNERVLALVLSELGLSPSDPPYGLKSAETVRKLRKALKMSL
jgi:hypothetical protein